MTVTNLKFRVALWNPMYRRMFAIRLRYGWPNVEQVANLAKPEFDLAGDHCYNQAEFEGSRMKLNKRVCSPLPQN